MMNAGKLKTKIKFFEYEKVKNASGGFGVSNTKLIRLTTFAEIKQIKATRTAENLQEAINTVYEIKLRQRANFYPKSDYIVEFMGKLCNITGVSEDIDKQKQWIITAVTNPLMKNVTNPVEVDQPEPYTVGEEIEDGAPYTLTEYNAL